MGTLLWTDDFESYTAGVAIPSPWANVANTPVATAQAHGGAKSCPAGTSGNNSLCSRPFGSSQTQWYADFWMWTNPIGATTNQYVSFTSSSSTGTGSPSVNVGQTGAGRCGPANGTPWFTFSVSLSTWHHYLFEVLGGATTGTAKLTIDGTVAGTFTGDTRDVNSSTSVSNVFIVGATIGGSPVGEFFVDDLSIYSGVVAGAQQAMAMVMA